MKRPRSFATMRRLILLGLLCWLPATARHSFAQSPEADTVLQAMGDELERSIAGLQLKGTDKPYFIQYTVIDEDEYTAEATFGALTSSRRTLQRIAHAQVRVGSYEFDNSEFVTGQGPPFAGVLTQTVTDSDYAALRHELWLATDAAYKQAVEVRARKKAFLQNKVQEEQLPDFSREKPTRALASRTLLTIDSAKMEKQLREWSRLFRGYPAIQASEVTLRARMTHRYIANSEGTRTLQPELVVSVVATASAQAPDGMILEHSVPFHSRSFEQLPAAETIADAIRRMAADLTQLHSAPVLDADYSGPVLLTGSASAEMFERVLAPNLSGQRPPMSERPQQGAAGSELLERMNRPVLPPYFAVFDDPAQASAHGRELIGHYEVDDQGVPAQRVSLIEDGLLTDLLMARKPAKNRPQSNGHGRAGYPGREIARIGNLFVEAKEGKSYEELKQELLRLGKIERLQYCLIIKSVAPDGRGPIGAPILAYKVYLEDGREELVRGASAQTLSVGSLRHIQAAGNDAFVWNQLAGTPGAETPVSVVAPSVLLEEMSLRRPDGAREKPAILTHPYFEN